MRISGGLWGGRILKTPRGSQTRPTSDANRQALFNILSHGFGHSMHRVLDMFAGSGALAFEALSRGAQKAYLFEKSREALEAIRLNTLSLGLNESQVEVIAMSKPEEWAAHLTDTLRGLEPLDTLFCDPPYHKGLALRALKGILRLPTQVVGSEAVLCLEQAVDEEALLFEGWVCAQRRERGASALSFYKRA